MPSYIKDGKILWIQTAKVGTPPQWAPGANYKLGDTVVPITVPAGFESYMWQCVGFLGKSASQQPNFPSGLGATIIDGNIVWTTRDPSVNPPAIDNSEYYAISELVVAQ